MALLAYARDADDKSPVFAIIADDEGADYIWPEGVEPWLPEDRAEFLAGDNPPTDAEGWLELASSNLGIGIIVTEPEEIDDVGDAVDMAEAELGAADEDLGDTTPFQASVAEAFDQVSQDYPGAFEADDEGDPESLSAEAMDNMVLMALGPIDPDGPNGWILRAMDGNPDPEDENEYVHIPGETDPAEGEGESEDEE